jgi:hypothetical protein
MFRTLTLAITLFAFMFADAQVKTPRPSPLGKVFQTVGLTDIEVEYYRPSAKDRVVFGDLVPFGKPWRTGANANTKISFSTDVTIDGKELKKGTYALYSIPGAGEWEIIFYAESNNNGLPAEWNEEKVSLRTTAKAVKEAKMIETFTIGIGDISNNDAAISLAWEKTSVSVKVSVPTESIAMKSIESVMAGPSGNDYAAASLYYLEEGKDLNKALEWAKKAVEMTGDYAFWLHRRQALIEAKLGDKTAAIESAKRSLESAKKAGNEDYIKMNEDSIKEWSK